jgi:hypothetical protein
MKYTLIIFAILLLVSCENEVDSPDWPEHEPKFVVTASLRIEADSVFVFCRVSRTMALGEEYRVDRAMVNDAEIQVRHDGVAWPIPFRTNYYPYSNDVNYIGQLPRGTSGRFVLSIRKGSLDASATLDIPTVPLHFDTLILVPGQPYYERTLQFRLQTPMRRIGYDLVLEERLSNGRWQESPWSGQTLIEGAYQSVSEGSFWYGKSSTANRVRYRIVAVSPVYRDYENSRWYSSSGGSPFEPEPNNPAFNIEGDGIGFFWYELVGDPVEIVY